MFLEKVEAVTIEFRGAMILFLRTVIGGTPAFDKDEVVAGFPRARLLSFIVADQPATTSVDQ